MSNLFRNFPRIREYQVLAYRIFLVYLFYFISRLLFWIYNRDLIRIDSVEEYLRLSYHGLAFDTTAILYSNSLFILLSVLPLKIHTRKGFQRVLKIIYFAFNLLALALNFIDFIYYRFTFSRSTMAALESLQNESNKFLLLRNFIWNYWHVFALFALAAILWVYLYQKVKIYASVQNAGPKYFLTSTVAFIAVAALCIGGIRGDFKKSTRPINLLDASRYVSHISQSDVVLNTPFAMIRTLNTESIRKVNFVSWDVIEREIQPIKKYGSRPLTRPNIVIIILESYGREYISSFNPYTKIPGYIGYSPFVDSLAKHSLIFTNAYANGHKSIHGMSSVIAGIPSFQTAFTSSPYPKQKIESLVSTLESIGYNTSFFHGAPNGSMGFLGFANILGFDNYFGKAEFNDESEFDGVWGIWDEPFLQYFNNRISRMPQPFFATMFTVSSHEPYKIPEKYEGKFPEGDVNIHKTIGYTDHALKKFFESAAKQPWFDNTIFVLVADHGNTIHYDEYRKELNKHTVPIMFYKPGNIYTGVNHEYAQQIDIYPTLLDMIGYQKPFRSWGRSLLGSDGIEPFVIRYSANNYQFMSGDYICIFDGRKVTGFFHKNDKALERNLLGSRRPEFKSLEIKCKAFIQDYMSRIVDRNLTAPN